MCTLICVESNRWEWQWYKFEMLWFGSWIKTFFAQLRLAREFFFLYSYHYYLYGDERESFGFATKIKIGPWFGSWIGFWLHTTSDYLCTLWYKKVSRCTVKCVESNNWKSFSFATKTEIGPWFGFWYRNQDTRVSVAHYFWTIYVPFCTKKSQCALWNAWNQIVENGDDRESFCIREG